MFHIISKVKSIGKFFLKFLTVKIWNLNLKISPLENQKNNGSIKIKTLGKIFDSVYEIYISGLKIIIFVTVKDIFDLEDEKFNIFSPFLMIFDEISWTQTWFSQQLYGIRIFWELCTNSESICDRSRVSDTHNMFRNEKYFWPLHHSNLK